MTKYAKMNYDELRKIADDDSIADNISDEEYDSLSTELWKKFSAEKVITQQRSSFAALSLNQEEHSNRSISFILNNLRKCRPLKIRFTNSRSGGGPPSRLLQRVLRSEE